MPHRPCQFPPVVTTIRIHRLVDENAVNAWAARSSKSGVRDRLINGVAIYQENLFDLRANGMENLSRRFGRDGVGVLFGLQTFNSQPCLSKRKLHAH
ncbi:MAG: hypothetical protein IMHGJWDQ_001574 [Candidatus Fervidibacter sp.]